MDSPQVTCVPQGIMDLSEVAGVHLLQMVPERTALQPITSIPKLLTVVVLLKPKPTRTPPKLGWEAFGSSDSKLKTIPPPQDNLTTTTLRKKLYAYAITASSVVDLLLGYEQMSIDIIKTPSKDLLPLTAQGYPEIGCMEKRHQDLNFSFEIKEQKRPSNQAEQYHGVNLAKKERDALDRRLENARLRKYDNRVSRSRYIK